MNIKYCIYIFLSLAFFFLHLSMKAQVTIGSTQKPVSGALLDLKQENDGSSSKGLLLPRVALTDSKNLFPMLTGNESDYSIQKTNHTGLIVFNTNQCFSNTGRDQGIYVWDGNEWGSLEVRAQVIQSPDVDVYTDTRDNERYLYRTFGTAGTWMLQNMRAKIYHPIRDDIDENPANGLTGPVPVMGVHGDELWTYPNVSKATYEKDPTMGLLYSWQAVTHGKGGASGQDISIDEGEGNGSPNPIPTNIEEQGPQGICPPGWHVPSDKEWNRLEMEIAEHPEKYSKSTVSTAWSIPWDYTLGYRPAFGSLTGHSVSMTSVCPAPDNSAYPLTGESLLAIDGGFNGIPTGSVGSAGASSYSEVMSFWTSSTESTEKAWARYFVSWAKGVWRTNTERYHMLSIRCKMN